MIFFEERKHTFSHYLSFWKNLLRFQEKPALVIGYTGMLPLMGLLKNINLAALVSLDGLLYYPSYRVEEKAAARIYNLFSIAPKIIIQTFHPTSTFLRRITKGRYSSFFSEWLQERKEFGYPPLGNLLLVKLSHKYLEGLNREIQFFKDNLLKINEIKEVHIAKPYIRRKMFFCNVYLKAKDDFREECLVNILPQGAIVDVNPEVIT